MGFFGIFKFFWYQWTSLYERKCESTEGFEWWWMGAYGEREVFKELFPSVRTCQIVVRSATSGPCHVSRFFILSFIYRHFHTTRLQPHAVLFVCFYLHLPLSIRVRSRLSARPSLCWCIRCLFTLDQSTTLACFIHLIHICSVYIAILDFQTLVPPAGVL